MPLAHNDPTVIYAKPSEAVPAVESFISLRMPVLLTGMPGIGKCLGRSTPVLMFDGTVRPVEQILPGDQLMGPDSTPREVLSTTRGVGPLYRVTPTKGDSYVVNAEHVLSLRRSFNLSHGRRAGGEVVNLPVTDYLKSAHGNRHHLKGWRTGVDFENKSQLPIIEPYFLGVWLGDGSCHTNGHVAITTADPETKQYLSDFAESMGLTARSDKHLDQSGQCETIAISAGRYGPRKGRNPLWNAINTSGLAEFKHIPRDYLTGSRDIRMQVLAGLLDTDGWLSPGMVTFEISSKFDRLATDILFLARSLGFAAYDHPSIKASQNGTAAEYHRITISGDVDAIPTRLPRKQAPARKQKKNVLVTGITVEPIGDGEYFGFALGGDHLFLLGDFTVTHNSDIMAQIAERTGRKLFAGLRASMLDAVDLRGMPVPDIAAGLTRWIPPAFYPNADTGPSILFLDELGRGQRDVQNAMMMLTLERKAGEMTLPDDCAIVAATNRKQDGPGMVGIEPALANRFAHINLVVDHDDWVEWAYTHDIEPAVIAFIRMRPKLLSVVDPDEIRHGGNTEENNRMGLPANALEYIPFNPKAMAFPTPRTWAMASAVVKQNNSPAVEKLMLAGVIGHECAVQFSAFAPIYREMDAAQIDYILQHPSDAPVPAPEKVNERFIVASALSYRANEGNLPNVITYLERMPGEYAAFAMYDATKRDRALRSTREYMAWYSRHSG